MSPSSAAPARYGVPCRPPLWARGGHAQTILSHVLPAGGPRIGEGTGWTPRRVDCSEGDRLLLFERAGTSGVRALLFHGLSGDVNSEYLRLSANELVARGHGVWAVNHRGCGEGAGLAARPYHSGRTEDMQAVLAASRAQAPELVHVVVGFSLSGNLVLLHTAQEHPVQPDAFVAVNPPVDLHRASIEIGRGWNRLYELRFLHRLRRVIKEREEAGLLERRYDIPRGASLIEFDDLFTAPECGFSSGLDYYRRCSSLPHLQNVRTPGVLLTAGDDPFVLPELLTDSALPPDVLLHVEPRGGHVGYLASRGLGLWWSRWIHDAIAHYVEELAGTSAR